MDTRHDTASSDKPVEWEALYWELMPRVYNFFRYRLGDDALAEDLTAITFVRAWRARQQYTPQRAAVSTWVFSIARHVAVDHYRQHRPHLPLDEIDDPRDPTDLEEIVQRRADADRLTQLLCRLSERDRELIALKYGADLTNRAISAISGLSESNVGTILHRLILRLRQQWETAP